MTIAVVEDCGIYRAVLSQLCMAVPGVRRVVELDDLASLRKALADTRVDLILLDIDLPDGSGLHFAAELLLDPHRPRVVVISAHDESSAILRVEEMGLEGYLEKSGADDGRVAAAIQAVHAGRRYYSAASQQRREAIRRDPGCFNKVLSAWEIQILGLIGQALDDEEIGGILGLAASTVQMHRSRIMRKLDVAGTPKLIRYAIDHGIVPAMLPR